MSLRIESLGWEIEITWRGMTLLPLGRARWPERLLEKRRRRAGVWRKRKAVA